MKNLFINESDLGVYSWVVREGVKLVAHQEDGAIVEVDGVIEAEMKDGDLYVVTARGKGAKEYFFQQLKDIIAENMPLHFYDRNFFIGYMLRDWEECEQMIAEEGYQNGTAAMLLKTVEFIQTEVDADVEYTKWEAFVGDCILRGAKWIEGCK